MYSGMMNNNRTKALFFDIDGTLLSEKTRRVPDSAKEALKQAREKGHLVLINTGRVYPHLTQIRSQVDADGFLCGCGTYVRVRDEVLYHHMIPHERGLQIKRDIDECGLDGVLEGLGGCYMHETPSRLPQVERVKQSVKISGCQCHVSGKMTALILINFTLVLMKKAAAKSCLEECLIWRLLIGKTVFMSVSQEVIPRPQPLIWY